MTRLTGGLLAFGIAGLLLTQAVRAEDSIKGQVVFKGPLPKVIDFAADPQYKVPVDCKKCAPGGKILSEDWVIDPKTKGVQNVVVFLVDADPKKALVPIPHPDMKAIQAKKVVLDQPCCTFIPHVVVLVEGQTLEGKNSSAMPHNMNIVSPQPKMDQNNLLPPGGSILIPGWKAIGKPSNVSCGVHTWMKAWIFTVPSPYFALTDKDGNFEIKDVPPGNYRLVYWHESQGWAGKGKSKEGDAVTVVKGGVNVGKTMVEN